MTNTDGAASSESLVFDDKIELGDFVGVSIKNALLNIVTLGFYRFWGKTDVRRRLWQRIRLNGEAFEYTGRGKELFLGFLLALVVLAVPYLAIILAVQFLSKGIALLIFVAVYLAFIVLIGAAIFLAFRYIASRTTWRGIRFHLTGSPFEYSLAFIGYTLLTVITLGWYAPAASLNLAEKLWGQLKFGDQKLGWRPPNDAPSIYGPFAIAWVIYVVGLVVYALLRGGMSMGANSYEDVAAAMGASALFMVCWLVALVCAWANYHAALLRRMAASITFGDAAFSLNLRSRSYLGLAITNVLILVFTLGILLPVIQARTARFIIRRLKSQGEAPLSAALQAPPGPRTGEGLADAFDLGII